MVRADYDRVLLNSKYLLKKEVDKKPAMNYINNVVKASKSKIVDLKSCQNYQGCALDNGSQKMQQKAGHTIEINGDSVLWRPREGEQAAGLETTY